MRALIFDGQAVRFSAAHPPPVAGPDMAVVRLLRAGISALDIEVCRGLGNHTGVLGHQFVGVVESIASASRSNASLAGARVVGTPISSCAKCDMCQSGLSEHCRARTIMGYSGASGCLAERFVVPISNLTVVPQSVDDDHAVFALELASAIQASRRLTIERRPYITVLGDNSQAMLMAQVMLKLNASVRLIGTDQKRLAVCEKWGVKHRHQDEVGRRGDQDIVVECTGLSLQFELATELVRPRGTIALAGLTATPGPLSLQRVVLNELQVLGTFAPVPVVDALEMLARREIDVVNLMSRRMSLNDAQALLKTSAQPGMFKVLVEP